jgi:hypothetical protein
MERAVAKAIAQCKTKTRWSEEADALLAKEGQPPRPRAVMVKPWHVCMAVSSDPPTPARLKSAVRAMHSFVDKHPQYGLFSGVGRGTLALYERGDKLSTMWAKLNSQRRKTVVMKDAEAALGYVKARRNEPFSVHERRQLDYVVLSTGKEETRRRKQVYRDIDLPVERERTY